MSGSELTNKSSEQLLELIKIRQVFFSNILIDCQQMVKQYKNNEVHLNNKQAKTKKKIQTSLNSLIQNSEEDQLFYISDISTLGLPCILEALQTKTNQGSKSKIGSATLANLINNVQPQCYYLPSKNVVLELMLGCLNCHIYEETLIGYLHVHVLREKL